MRLLPRLFWLTFVVASTGCVSSAAGYRDAKTMVAGRIGVTVHPRAIDDEDTSKVVRDLLRKPLTADSAAKIALLHNAEVQAAFDRIGVARGQLVAAIRLPNPVVEGTLRFRKQSTDIGLAASINIIDLVFLPLREAAASSELDAAALEAAGTVMDVAYEARTAYYDCVAAEQSLELAKSVLGAEDAGAELSQELADAGNIPRLKVLVDRAMYEEARLALAEADGARSRSRERLNAALGLWGDAGMGWTVPARLEEPPENDPQLVGAEKIAIQKSLDLDIAKHRYAAAAQQANAARAQGVIPSLSLGVDAERDPEGWGVGPRIGIGVPLFYQGQGLIDASHAEMRRQQDLSDAMAVQIRAEARALVTGVTKARESTTFYKRTLLPLRQQIIDETQLHYNAMGMSAFQLLAAKRSAIESARGYVGALREYWAARATLDLLLAGRLSKPLLHDFGLGVRTSSGPSGE